MTASDREIVDHLLLAVALGDVDGALRLLAPDVVCLSDGGAAKRAARRPVVTAPRVARLLVNLARRHQESATVEHAEVNGDIGVVLSLSGTVDMVVQFEVDDGLVRTVRMVRNPDKLLHLADAGRLR